MSHNPEQDEPSSEYDFEEVERWASIPGMEGFYEASSFGQIHSIRRQTKSGISKTGLKWSGGKVLKPYISNMGYQRLELCIDGKRFKKSVHRLVAEAWIPNTFSKPCVNHLDNNPLNNHVSNLEWCTYHENMAHAEKQGRVNHTFKPGDNFVKLTPKDIVTIRNMRKVGASIPVIAKVYNMSESAIGRAVRGRTWRQVA